MCLKTYTQKIQYSRQNILMPFTDATEFIADISGRHHFLSFVLNEKSFIHVFDERLQLIAKKELPFKFNKGINYRVIPFKEFYFLQVALPGAPRSLWRINAQGDAVDLTGKFKELIDTAFKRNPTNVQLINKEDRVFIMANTYFRELNKIVATVVQLDKNLDILSNRGIVFPFKRSDKLKQVSLLGDDVYILKSSRDTSGYLLQLLKVNLNTGKSLVNFFNSSFDYSYASFQHTGADSGIVIYSLIQNVVFLTRLDNALKEKVPFTLLKTQFQNKVTTNNIFLPGEAQQSITVSYGNMFKNANLDNASADKQMHERAIAAMAAEASKLMRSNETPDQYALRIDNTSASATSSYNNRFDSRTSASASHRDEAGVRFSVLDHDLTIVKDSIMINRKKENAIDFGSCANVVMSNKNYMIYKQSFPGKRQGLLAIYRNEENKISTKDIRVFDKYEYQLQDFKSVDKEYIIMPYRHKREIGLVKITMKD